MNWTKEKPQTECVFATAEYWKNHTEYNIWELKFADGYLKLLTGDGDEWGDIADLKADLYFVLPQIKP